MPLNGCVCILPPGFATGNRWHIGTLLVRPVVREIALAPDDFGIWRRGYYPHLGLVAIGASAAEKLEATSRWVDADPLPFLPVFLSTPVLPISFIYSSFPLPLNSASRSRETL